MAASLTFSSCFQCCRGSLTTAALAPPRSTTWISPGHSPAQVDAEGAWPAARGHGHACTCKWHTLAWKEGRSSTPAGRAPAGQPDPPPASPSHSHLPAPPPCPRSPAAAAPPPASACTRWWPPATTWRAPPPHLRGEAPASGARRRSEPPQPGSAIPAGEEMMLPQQPAPSRALRPRHAATPPRTQGLGRRLADLAC